MTDVETLVDENTRGELDAMATELGLDPDSYGNKTEIAEAIVAGPKKTTGRHASPFMRARWRQK